ncbi:MAG: ribokinase [Planctomycetaceae bacterium]|nr:ribokinase [Planctomycetaceae bacterium]MBQ2821765.1 ribokinase [Thermoguttaceae bacterium]
MAKIVVVGSSNTDMVIKSRTIPRPGETVIGGTFVSNAGGKGANQAVAAARLGGNVALIARVGKDMFGEEAKAGFQREEIDISCVKTDETAATGIALILVDEKAENSISVASGANENLSPADVDEAEEKFSLISTADILVVQLETPMDTLKHTADLAARFGVPIILDPAPAPQNGLPEDLLSRLTLIKPNETEASFLTGVEVRDIDSAKEAAKILHARGVRQVIITLGKEGVLVSDGISEPTALPAISVQAVDSTAAGDAFSGALACGLAEGKSLIEAVKFAITAAGLSVTKLGAQQSMPTREEVERKMSEE